MKTILKISTVLVCMVFAITSAAQKRKPTRIMKSRVTDLETNKGVKCDIYKIMPNDMGVYECTTKEDGNFTCRECNSVERLRAVPKGENQVLYYSSTLISCDDAMKYGIKIRQNKYSTKNDSTASELELYCNTSDSNRLRFVRLSSPFPTLVDSINFNINAASNLLNMNKTRVDEEYLESYNYSIEQLSFALIKNPEDLNNLYLSYKAHPCDTNAYSQFEEKLTQLEYKLENTKRLFIDLNKLYYGGAITGSTASQIISRISNYISTLDEN